MALAVCVRGSQWEDTSIAGYSTLIGLDSKDSSTVYGAAGQSGKGSGHVISTDGGAHNNFVYPEGMLPMDVCVDSANNAVMVGVGSIWFSGFSQDEFVRTKQTGTSQSCASWGEGKFGVAGIFAGKNGVAVSTDRGFSWKTSDIGTNSSQYPARYAAFPSDETWFVTAGTWPMDGLTANTHSSYRVSQRLAVEKDSYSFPSEHKPKRNNVEGSMYFGAVFKTTDGGVTWSQVFTFPDNTYYPNAIHCADDDNCIFTAENTETSVGYRTTDGGKTWTEMVTEEMTGEGVSLMGAFMSSATDFWWSGGLPGRMAYFYHSTDGTNVDTIKVQGGYSTDISFTADGTGYSTQLGMNTCAIIKYA